VDEPPAYTARVRMSVLPGTQRFTRFLIAEYDDGRPSISLMGWVTEGTREGDVWRPGCGIGVGVVQLRDPEARTRFGVFGSDFVQRERKRRMRNGRH
jgi:hypothetical protein